jgi:hypothetical protein
MSNTFPLNKFEEYQDRIHSLEARVKELKEQLKNRLPMCPICGKEVALICADDLDAKCEQIKSLEAKAEQAESFEVNRLTTLLAETENARKWWQDKVKELQSVKQEEWDKVNLHLQTQNARLKEALKKYATHKGPVCADYMGDTGKECMCGLDDCLQQLSNQGESK